MKKFPVRPEALSAKAFLVFFITLALAGCATALPKIDSKELKAAQEIYEVKAERHIYHQIIRVRTVGARLLETVPKKIRPKNPKATAGIIIDDLTPVSARVFGIPADLSGDAPASKKACVIIGLIPKSGAARAGIKEGDLLLQVNGHNTETVSQAAKIFQKLIPHNTVCLLLEREEAVFQKNITMEAKPYPVAFGVADEESINAFALPGEIVVTTGLLRFVQSDDELAVVLAHELAHLTQGHIAKSMGPGIILGPISAIVGTAIDIVIPGGGNVINGVRAPFSQDFEREADYVGLQYAYAAGYKVEAGIAFWDRFATELPRSLSHSFFNTHPTSPERLLRLQKRIEELKQRATIHPSH